MLNLETKSQKDWKVSKPEPTGTLAFQSADQQFANIRLATTAATINLIVSSNRLNHHDYTISAR